MIRPFKFWCYKVLPLVYDDSLSYYEVLCKVVKYINEMLEELETAEGRIEGLEAGLEQLKQYVDHYFDNLDVQYEINNKLDEMAESGELDEIIGLWLNRTTVREVVDSDIYGQMAYDGMYSGTGYYPQGFTMFTHSDNHRYAMVGRVNETADPTVVKMQVMQLDYDEDNRLDSLNSSVTNMANLGHCNCMTYCDYDNLVYIACGGGSNGVAKIVAIDPLTLLIEKTFDYTNDVRLQVCSNICWDSLKQVFYICERGYIIEFDKDMTFVRQAQTIKSAVFRGTTVGQSAFTDGKFIYQIMQVGTPADVNILLMYNCYDLSFYKTTTLMIKGEVEGGVYFGGRYFVNRSANRNSLVYEIYPFADNHVGNYTYRNGMRTAIIARAEQNQSNDLYCDADYFGFRVDGDNADYPYNSLYNMLDNAYYNMDSMRMDLHIAGAQPHMLNIKKFTTLRIDGYTGKGEAGSVKGIYIRNGLDLIINGLGVTASNSINNSYVSIMDVNNFYLAYLTVDGDDVTDYLLRYPSSNGEIVNSIFRAGYSVNIIDGSNGGNVIIGAGNSFGANLQTDVYDIYANDLTVLPRGSNYSDAYYGKNAAYGVITIPSPEDFDISRIRRGGIYRIIGEGATFTNVPEAITDNFGFRCTNIAGASVGDGSGHHLLIYDVLTNAGVYYKVIMRDTTLTWYDVTGTVVDTFTVTV